MSKSQPALEIVGLGKTFERGAAVRNVNLRLEQGEVISLLGPSGCGKTTTLRCVAGFYKPDEGTITIGGRLVASPTEFVAPEDRRIAMVFQNYVLWPHMTAFQNIAYGLKLRRLPRSEIAARVAEMVNLLGLKGLEERYPHQLSGGQQQRVSVARSLVVRPDVLLLDEPFSNLDAKLRVQMRQELRDVLQRLEISAVYVTHDQEEAMVLSDRIMLMDGGELVEEGTPLRLFENPRTQFAANFFGVLNLLPGRFDDAGGKPVLKIDGLETPVSLSPAQTGKAGGRYVLGLRQDAIEVVEAVGQNQGWISGRIRSRYYIGGAVDLEIECSQNQILRCRVNDSSPIGWNDAVALRILPERAILLPDSGRS